MCGLNVSFPGRLSVRRPGTTPGSAAPPGWSSSIEAGEEASRWESVSVSGGAPGLISFRRSGLGSMEQRSLRRGELFRLVALAVLRFIQEAADFCWVFHSNRHVPAVAPGIFSHIGRCLPVCVTIYHRYLNSRLKHMAKAISQMQLKSRKRMNADTSTNVLFSRRRVQQ